MPIRTKPQTCLGHDIQYLASGSDVIREVYLDLLETDGDVLAFAIPGTGWGYCVVTSQGCYGVLTPTLYGSEGFLVQILGPSSDALGSRFFKFLRGKAREGVWCSGGWDPTLTQLVRRWSLNL